MRKSALILLTGDLLVLAAVTLVGFATHGETGVGMLPRMLTTFLPLTFAWLLAALAGGLLMPESTTSLSRLWRPVAAMFLAGPLAVLLRALWLGTVALPVFGLILSASAALGMLAWRAAWVFLQRRLPA